MEIITDTVIETMTLTIHGMTANQQVVNNNNNIYAVLCLYVERYNVSYMYISLIHFTLQYSRNSVAIVHLMHKLE